MRDFRHGQPNSVPLRIELLNIIISKNNSEKVGVVLDRVMAPSDPEVLVDQVSDLPSTKETVLLGALCSSRLTFILNWVLWMIRFSAEAILAPSTPLPPPNVRPRKIIPGRTDIQANSERSKRTLS